jgi:Ribosomal protein L7/L12 C-terminal domain
MTTTLLIWLLIGGICAPLIRLIVSARRSDKAALSRVEAKLDALLQHQGIRFDPYSNVPPTVADALRSGRKIDAIKAYRVATGAGLKDAKDFVEEVQGRAAKSGNWLPV